MTSETENHDYPPIDNSSIAPCKKGIPDLYNHIPSRLISLVEAKARGWTYFYEKAVCPHGHMAPRYVSNPRMCVDCHRVKKNLQPIGAECSVSAGTSENQRITSSAGRSKPLRFEWTPEKRSQLIEEWVDTGDLATAREAIGVTPAEYLREVERNADFAEEVSLAGPKADKMLEEKAIALALNGNDRLLTKILAAKFPDLYRESIKVDVTQTAFTRMTDEKIDARLAYLLRNYGGLVIDGESVETKLLPLENVKTEGAA